MSCEDCDPKAEYDGYEGCVNGSIYGFCTSDECYGYCSYYGPCPCECHKPMKLTRQ